MSGFTYIITYANKVWFDEIYVYVYIYIYINVFVYVITFHVPENTGNSK